MKEFWIKAITVGELATNCYIVKSGEDGLVIDPGGDGELILNQIKLLGVKVVYVLNTHGHFDHILANDEVRDSTGAQVAIHRLDADCLTSSVKNSSLLMGYNLELKPADIFLEDGQLLPFGSSEIRVIHTPGHTPGSVSFLINNKLFSGDLIFAGSIGRTDLPGGSSTLMIESLKKIKMLPRETVIYPGHGPQTTLKEELERNFFLIEVSL